MLCAIAAQEIQHEAVAINIEVPVRVYMGDTFIDNLTIKDFEVYEDGKLQKVEAVYLINKTDIKREEIETPIEESARKFVPQTSRQFVLVFELQDWFPKVGESIDYFFNEVIAPEDSLIVMTPRNTYNLNSQALQKMNKEQCADQLKSKLRKDTVSANGLYHSIVRGVIELLQERSEFDGDFEMKLARIHDMYGEWRGLKYVEETSLLRFADFIKSLSGQKHVFLFYQREVLPQFSPRELSDLIRLNQDQPQILGKLYDLIYLNRDINIDENKINAAFSDASISMHFLYLTKTQDYALEPTHMLPFDGNISMEDKSSNIYSAFRKLADATGGISDSSANANFLFKKAVDASENYYLLYYTPKDYKSDGKFHNIKVKIKGKNYKVLHRAGYLAD
jgi:hypothetical protein